MKASALLLTDDIVVSSSVVLSVSAAVRDIITGEPDCSIITQASALSKLPFDSSLMDAVVCIAKISALNDDNWFQEIFRVLKPGSIILVQSSIPSGETVESSTTLERKLLLAGFSEVQTLQIEMFLPMDGSQYFTVKAKKALWEVGSSFTIKKPVRPLPKIQVDDDSDLIDEDTLLTEEDLIKPQLPSMGDCEIGSTRKACKSCTCGRAEVEEQKIQKLSLMAEQINIPQSACGNCGLGDAFRCGGCPYRGLPAFQLGDKVSLAANFLVADI